MPDTHETDTYNNTLNVIFEAIRRHPDSPQAQAFVAELHKRGWTATEIQARIGSTFDVTAPAMPTLSGPTPSTRPTMAKLHETFGGQGYRGKMPRARKQIK